MQNLPRGRPTGGVENVFRLSYNYNYVGVRLLFDTGTGELPLRYAGKDMHLGRRLEGKKYLPFEEERLHAFLIREGGIYGSVRGVNV